MPRILDRTERLAWRQTAGIKDRIGHLEKTLPGVDRNLAIQFARGHHILSAYEHLLSEDGHALLTRVNALAQNPLTQNIEEVLPQLPSVQAPQLHLFKNPFSNETLQDPDFRAFKAEFNKGNEEYEPRSYRTQYSIIQLASGCQNYCLMCAAQDNEKQQPIKFMPFPMVILLAKQLFEKNSHAHNLSYFNSDPLQWKDSFFDADYGDLAVHLKELGIDFSGATTLGFWPGDVYAEEAASKLRENKIQMRLSVHLMHKKLFPSPNASPTEAMLDKYAERVAHSSIALDINEFSALSINRVGLDYWSSDYLTKLFKERVVPKIEEATGKTLISAKESLHLKMFLRGCMSECIQIFVDPENSSKYMNAFSRSKYRYFPHGTVDRALVTEIFGEEDDSWQQFFSDYPKGKTLSFKGNIEALLEESIIDQEKKNSLLALLKNSNGRFSGRREDFKLDDPAISPEEEDVIFNVCNQLFNFSPFLSWEEAVKLVEEYFIPPFTSVGELCYEGRIVNSPNFSTGADGFKKGSIFTNMNYIIGTDGTISVLINSKESERGVFIKAPTVGEYFKTADNLDFEVFLKSLDHGFPNRTLKLWNMFPSFQDTFSEVEQIALEWSSQNNEKERIFDLLKDLPCLPSDSEKYKVVLPFKANLGVLSSPTKR